MDDSHLMCGWLVGSCACIAGRDGLPAKCVLLAPMTTIPTLLPSPGRSHQMTTVPLVSIYLSICPLL
eukprot:COSAG05_NODE_77_length_21410_cov_1079.308573_7_plen_67_part_00